MKFKRQRSLVFIVVIAALLIAIAVFGYVQRSNLQAFLMSVRYSEEELITLQEQSASDLLEKYGLKPIPPLKNAEVSPDSPSDVVAPPASMTDDPPSPQVPENTEENPEENPSVSPKAEDDSPKDSTDKKDHSDVLPKDVQDLVYSLYTLQSQYLGKLEGIRASTLAQFKALPPKEQTLSKQASIVKSGLSRALSLEKQCDGRVASILRELRSTLKKHGLDDSVADSAENYYANQKGLIKAEYMRKYNKYLK